MHLADRTAEALEAITEAEALAERFENRFWCAELHRLRSLFLADVDADETENSVFLPRSLQHREAAEVKLATRAEAT